MIPTYIAPSRIHGIGLFARELIPVGTTVYRYDPRVDLLITRRTLLGLPRLARATIEHYAPRVAQDLYLLPGDDARFINHASPGNIACREWDLDTESAAMCNILAGEEIVEDYRNFSIEGPP